jgi:hypothetical protein
VGRWSSGWLLIVTIVVGQQVVLLFSITTIIFYWPMLNGAPDALVKHYKKGN